MTTSKLKRYEAILAGVETISVTRVASIVNRRASKVRTDLQNLIDSNEISDIYIDYGEDIVVSKKYTPKSSYKTVVKCFKCGSHNELIVGITRECNYCREPLLLEPLE